MLTYSEFNQALGEITSYWGQKDFAGALERIAGVMERGSAIQLAQCLLFKGLIKQDEGSPKEALEAWLLGRSHSPIGSFVRSSLEYEIGRSYEKQGDRDGALALYRASIDTCARGGRYACHKALVAYLALSNGKVPPTDAHSVADAIEKSWSVFELPGHPDPADLPASINRLADGLTEKIRRMNEE